MIRIDVSPKGRVRESKVKCALIYLFMLLPFARMDVYEIPKKSWVSERLYKRRKLIQGRMVYDTNILRSSKMMYHESCFEKIYSFTERLKVINAALMYHHELMYHADSNTRTVLTFGIK